MKESQNPPKTDEQMLRVYRHDAHKMHGQPHDNAPEEMAGVPVNEKVPYDADADAAAMSRPNGKPEQTLPGHETHYRRSLRTGETRYDPDEFSLRHYDDRLEALIATDDAVAAHRAWLRDDVVAWFNESWWLPHTSLKYHTLLVAALVDLYRNGAGFDDAHLELRANDDTAPTPHRTVFEHTGGGFADAFELVVVSEPNGETATKLSSYPMRNFASVWARLPTRPWDGADTGVARVVDSQLRRIRSWSTGLQYLEDCLTASTAGDGTEVDSL